MVIRVSREPSLALTSVGSDSPVWGEPLLWWASPEDPTSTLFTLDDAIGRMERESLNMGIVFVLEALDHTQDALHDVVVPSGWVFTWPCFLPFSISIYFCILTIVSFQSLITRSRGKSWFLHE